MDGDIKELIKQLKEEAEIEALKQSIASNFVKKPKKDYGKFVEVVGETVLGFYGLGVVINTLATLAANQTITTTTQIFGGQPVLGFLAMGIGLGIARGHKEAISDRE